MFLYLKELKRDSLFSPDPIHWNQRRKCKYELSIMLVSLREGLDCKMIENNISPCIACEDSIFAKWLCWVNMTIPLSYSRNLLVVHLSLSGHPSPGYLELPQISQNAVPLLSRTFTTSCLLPSFVQGPFLISILYQINQWVLWGETFNIYTHVWVSCARTVLLVFY